MRALRGMAWMLGGLCVATLGLVIGAALGYEGAGPGVALACLGAGVCMVNRGLDTW